ncbi:MAG: branched-chain amino acid ABC transporter permease [Alphaproteobacteria bacterium]|nr:branched-chain amino acid ABC transporter permease [Alphaproteobacteria bacterium]
MASGTSAAATGGEKAPPTLGQKGWDWAEALPWLVLVGALFTFPGYLALGCQVIVMIIFALSLDLVLGYAGIITLGHAALFGTGAYAAGMLSAHGGWNEPITGLLFAGAVAGLVGFASGWFLLRYRGLTLLMLTLATAILLQELANTLALYTGGFDGLLGIAIDPLLGRFDNDLFRQNYYVYGLCVLFVLFLVVRRIVTSPFGQSLVGIRENVQRMNAIGAPVHGRLVAVYTIAAAIAGIAGGLFAQMHAFVTLQVMGFQLSGAVLIAVILGGAGRLYGAFIGATIYVILEDQLAKLSPEFWEFGVGLVLVATVMFARRGLFGVAEDIARLGKRRS